MGLYSKIKKRWSGCSNQTGTSLLGRVGTTDEYLNALYAPVSKHDVKELEKYISSTKSFDKKVLKRLFDVLSEHNGAVLYGGGIVFFGATDNGVVNQFAYPASIIKMNNADYVSSHLKKVLYIGNALHKSKDNINFYYNLENGIVSGYLKGEIIISWKNLEDFYEYIFTAYDDCYGDDGVHKFYNDKKHFVYRNVQLFDEEKS
jgi:hypothetical protein